MNPVMYPNLSDFEAGAGNPKTTAGQAPYMAAGYHIDPGGSVAVPWVQGASFPLDGPGSGWDIVQTSFLPAWFSAPDDIYDYVSVQWFTNNLQDVNVDLIGPQVVQGFIDQGEGTPLAFRLWHKTVFNVQLPNTFTLPNIIPFGIGGTHNVPFGGSTLASLEEWHLQLIYHNVIPVVVVIGLVLVACFITLVIADVITNGKVTITHDFKGIVEQFTPSSIASSIGTVFILGMGLVVALAIAVPQLTSSTSIHAGPISTSIGSGGARPANRPR